MKPKDPLRLTRMPDLKMDTMYRCLKDGLKHPVIGVTQGGSSRKNTGARVAATDASVKPRKGP